MSLKQVALNGYGAIAPECATTRGASRRGGAPSPNQDMVEPSSGVRPSAFIYEIRRYERSGCALLGGSGLTGLTGTDRTNARYDRFER